MCTIRFSSSVRPTIDPRSGLYKRSRTRRSYSGVMLVKAAIRYSSLSPSRRAMLPVSAWQSRTARSITVCRTASRSKVVRAIVWTTSRTAASRSSARSRSRWSSAASPGCAPASLTSAILADQPLLLVALDGLGVAHVSRIRILARLTERAALTEQVPALVEADLDRLEPVVLVGVQPAFADAVVELVLLGDELLDPLVDLGVIHVVEHATGEYRRGARRCDGIHAFWRRRTPWH